MEVCCNYPDTYLLIASLDEVVEISRANKNMGVYKGAFIRKISLQRRFWKQGLRLYYYKKKMQLEEDFCQTKDELVPVEEGNKIAQNL